MKACFPGNCPAHVRFLAICCAVGAILLAFLSARAADKTDKAAAPAQSSPSQAPAPRDAKEALAAFNPLVGEWRGVGQVRRGSSDGAWTEKGEWVWEFGKGAVAIRYVVEKGKLLQSGTLTWNAKERNFRFEAALPDESQRVYTGTEREGRLVLVSPPDDAGDVHRMTVTQLNPKRTLVLYETQRKGSTMFSRVAEVGYSREGTRLAAEGSNGPECVVTGGAGTIKVSYKGQTYYVCCTGCKQAFDDDPEGILADYKKRLAERNKP